MLARQVLARQVLARQVLARQVLAELVPARPLPAGLDAAARRAPLALALLALAGLAAAERPAQLRREAQPALGIGMRQRREDLQAAAAGFLGPGYRGVGVAPDMPGRAAVGDRDPDAGGQGHAAVGGPERLGRHTGQDAPGAR